MTNSLLSFWRKVLSTSKLNRWLRREDGSSVFAEVVALLKAGVFIISVVGLLALLTNLPSGSSRVVTATVISNASSKFSQTSHYAIAQLENGAKVQIRLASKKLLEPGQLIEIHEHSSLLSDIPSYSYPVKSAE